MKLVIQRVKSASVAVQSKVVGKIDLGIFILVGVGIGDTKQQAKALAQKVAKLRIMADENDKMNLSVKDTNTQILAVSQFTLYADTSSGNRPSFVKAEEPTKASEVYEYFITCLKEEGIKVEIGSFGNYMDIDCELDGPVTIVIDG